MPGPRFQPVGKSELLSQTVETTIEFHSAFQKFTAGLLMTVAAFSSFYWSAVAMLLLKS